MSLPVIAAQIDAVLSDLNVGAIKIGMLATPEIIGTLADSLAGFEGPIVLDPVMVAKSGDALLQDDAVGALVEKLLPRATVLTPNLPEAARLLSTAATEDDDALVEQGKALLALGPKTVLMKGGHASGDICHDHLVSEAGVQRFSAKRVATNNTHGTGCTLSSSIAAGLAKGLDVSAAVAEAHTYLAAAIRAADALTIGSGHGPVHHFHQFWGQNG